ncbi:MAG: DUF2334 domain-containing protein [Gemmatimonadaceae bacterium]
MKLLVSIHDVTPAHEANVLTLWSMCAERGVTPALLVVPRWHGDHALETFPPFIEWLRRCADSGAEIFLHGDRHDEAGLPRGIRHSIRAFGRTAGEGEFLTLSRAESRARIQRGLDLLRRLGFHVTGFVAPAWLSTPECEAAVRDCGLDFSEDSAAVTVHRRGTRVQSPVLRWSARSRARAVASSIVAEAHWRRRRARGLLRVALHPSDLRNPLCARSVISSMDRWFRISEISRYADL